MATKETTPTAPPEEQQQPSATTAIEPIKSTGIQQTIGLGPRTFEEGWRFAKMIANSDLAPKDYRNKPENVLVAIQMGAEVGLSPMAAIQNIAVINGRPSLWGDAALAVVQVHPAYEWHRETFEGTGDARAAVFEIKRRGQDPHVTRFSMADAKKAKLTEKDSPWKTYPDRMLQMRARGFGLRDKFADAMRGLIVAEEAMDLPPVMPGAPILEAEDPEKELKLEIHGLLVSEVQFDNDNKRWNDARVTAFVAGKGHDELVAIRDAARGMVAERAARANEKSACQDCDHLKRKCPKCLASEKKPEPEIIPVATKPCISPTLDFGRGRGEGA